MKISVQQFDNQFNVQLASKEGADPFLTIKGCRVVDGSKGRFVSWPAKKMESGKYWNHVYASEQFQAAVLAAYDEAAPKTRKAAPADDSDVPW